MKYKYDCSKLRQVINELGELIGGSVELSAIAVKLINDSGGICVNDIENKGTPRTSGFTVINKPSDALIDLVATLRARKAVAEFVGDTHKAQYRTEAG